MIHRYLAALVLLVWAVPGHARAAKPDRVKAKDPSQVVKEETLGNQQNQLKQFRDLRTALVRLKQLLELGDSLDRKQAEIIKEALKRIDNRSLETKYTLLVDTLKNGSLTSLIAVKEAQASSNRLAKELRLLLGILTKDSRIAQLRSDSKQLGELAAALDRVIEAERAVVDKIDLGKTSKDELRSLQTIVTRTTVLLAKRMAGETAAIGKQLEEAGSRQAQAEKDLAANKQGAAGKQLSEALRTLVSAKINGVQLRMEKEEEALSLLLKEIVNRCDIILERQRAVLAGTLSVDKAIRARRDKKPGRVEIQTARNLAQQEREIVGETDKVITELADKGDLIFPVLFRQVRSDLVKAQESLETARVGATAQEVQNNSIATLVLLQKTLRKAQDGLKPPLSASNELVKQFDDLVVTLRKLEKDQRDQIQDKLAAHEKYLVNQLLRAVE